MPASMNAVNGCIVVQVTVYLLVRLIKRIRQTVNHIHTLPARDIPIDHNHIRGPICDIWDIPLDHNQAFCDIFTGDIPLECD